MAYGLYIYIDPTDHKGHIVTRYNGLPDKVMGTEEIMRCFVDDNEVDPTIEEETKPDGRLYGIHYQRH